MLLFVSGVKMNTQLAKPAFFSTGPSCSRARRTACEEGQHFLCVGASSSMGPHAQNCIPSCVGTVSSS